MTAFHTDEYVHFLSKVIPETAMDLTYNRTRCELLFVAIFSYADFNILSQFLLSTTTPHLKVSLNSVLSQLADPSVWLLSLLPATCS
jgi:hypothetical protein